MPKKERGKPEVSAKASAKIEAVAKATFQRKKIITEVIAPDVTRAKAGAWLTLISPITEWAGLRGDALRYRREQLRIQQEEALLAIAQSVSRKMKGKRIVRPVPPKLLVPFLEKASLEDASDLTMIELWSNLLVSASSDETVPPRFVHIIGELNSRQAKLFIDVATKDLGSEEIDRHGIIFEMQEKYVEETLAKLFRRKKLTADDVYDEMMVSLELPGVALSDLIVNDSKGDSWSVLTSENRFGAYEVQADLQILTSLGLLREVRIDRQRSKSGVNDITVLYFLLTQMGVDFFEAVSSKPN